MLFTQHSYKKSTSTRHKNLIRLDRTRPYHMFLCINTYVQYKQWCIKTFYFYYSICILDDLVLYDL